MNVSQIRYFVEIAKHQSLSKAAEALFVSPSALSISISKLESELDAQLFERNRSGSFLTEQGKLILKDAQEIIATLSSWNFKLHPDSNDNISGTVRVLSCPAITQSLLIKVIKNVRSNYPKLHIVIEEGLSILQRINEEDINIALAMISDQDPILQEKLTMLESFSKQVELLYQESMCIYINKDNPLAKESSLTLDSLSRQTFLTYFYNELDTSQKKIFSVLPESQILSLPNRNAIFAYLHANKDAFAILSSSTSELPSFDHHPQIITKCFNNDSTTQNIFLIHPKTETLTPAERIVINLIKSLV